MRARRGPAIQKTDREQLPLLDSDKPTPRGPERTLDVNRANCGAKFVAYYSYEEEKCACVTAPIWKVAAAPCSETPFRRLDATRTLGHYSHRQYATHIVLSKSAALAAEQIGRWGTKEMGDNATSSRAFRRYRPQVTFRAS